MEKLLKDKSIDTIGNCANCGVEFHIHKEVEKDLKRVYVNQGYAGYYYVMPFELKNRYMILNSFQDYDDLMKEFGQYIVADEDINLIELYARI